MKTIKECQKEIKEIEVYIKNNLKDITERQLKNERNKIQFIRQIIRYLEHKPSESFLLTERQRLSDLIKSKGDQFDYWRINVAKPQDDPKKYLTVFNNEVRINDFKKSLKTIDYILK